MTARGPYYVNKDSWLSQLVGGTKQYGNGTGGLVMIGPYPNAVSGNPDIKSRGVFEISAADVAAALADLTSVDTATITLTVGPNTCGSRGSTIRLLLEEMTTDFGLKSASGDCGFSSGTGNNVWGISNNITIANRAFHSSGSHSTGDTLDFDITDMLEARRAAADYSALRFRIIAANSGGTGYDETTTARKIAVYSSRNATLTNHAKLNLTGTIGSVSKSMAETGTGADDFSISQSGTTPLMAELGAGEDAFAVSEAAAWETVLPGEDQGYGAVTVPSSDYTALALLSSVSEEDVLLHVRFQADKIPDEGEYQFGLCLRAIDSANYYRITVTCNPQQSAGLQIAKVVAGVETIIGELSDQRTLIADVDFWLQAQITGVSPTAIVAKFWRSGDTEPGWDLAVQDSEAVLQDAGTVGLTAITAAVTNAPVTFRFDDLEGSTP